MGFRYPPEIKTRALVLFHAGHTATQIARIVGVTPPCAHYWVKEWGHRPKVYGAIVSCPKGHPYTEQNSYIQAKGARICKVCRDISNRMWREGARTKRGFENDAV